MLTPLNSEAFSLNTSDFIKHMMLQYSHLGYFESPRVSCFRKSEVSLWNVQNINKWKYPTVIISNICYLLTKYKEDISRSKKNDNLWFNQWTRWLRTMEEICMMKTLFHISHLYCSFNNRWKLTKWMLISRQSYKLSRTVKIFTKPIKRRPNSSIFNLLQFRVYRITCVHKTRTGINQGLPHTNLYILNVFFV